MNQKVSALTQSQSHVFAGTLCGQVHWWSLTDLNQELAKPCAFQNDQNVDMEEMVDQTPTLKCEGTLGALGLGSVNQMAVTSKNELLIAHKNALSLVDPFSGSSQFLLPQETIGFVILQDGLVVALKPLQITVLSNNKQQFSKKLTSQATCISKLTDDLLAVGFENSIVQVYNLTNSQISESFQIDHKLPHNSIQGLEFDGSYLISAVNGVGIFKWLYISTSQNPEQNQASLVKIMPVARGFQINSLLKVRQELLVATSDSHLLKYEQTLGYSGYYKSQNLCEVYSILDVSCSSEMLLMAGKTTSKEEEECMCCSLELVQLKSNTLLVKLTF